MTSERPKRLLPITRGTSPELEARKVYLTHQELGGTFLSVPDRKDGVASGSNVMKDTFCYHRFTSPVKVRLESYQIATMLSVRAEPMIDTFGT